MDKTDPLDALAIADFARAQKITTEPWRDAQLMVRRKKESPPSIPKVSLHRRQTRVLTVTQIDYEISKLEF